MPGLLIAINGHDRAEGLTGTPLDRLSAMNNGNVITSSGEA